MQRPLLCFFDDKAEKYLKAAWILSQNSSIGDHLGQVYEAHHKTDLAVHMYQLALAASEDASLMQETPHPTNWAGFRPAEFRQRESWAPMISQKLSFRPNWRLRGLRCPQPFRLNSPEFVRVVSPRVLSPRPRLLPSRIAFRD